MKRGKDFNTEVINASAQEIGLAAGGQDSQNSWTEVLSYDKVSLKAESNAVLYGNLAYKCSYGVACSSPTQMLLSEGWATSPNPSNRVQEVDFKQDSTAEDFGDLSQNRIVPSAVSNGVIGCFCLGGVSFGSPNIFSSVVDYFLFAVKGNASNFGSMTTARSYSSGASNKIRAVVSHGYTNPASYSEIDSFLFATKANASSYGNATYSCYRSGACSNALKAVIVGGAANGGVYFSTMNEKKFTSSANAVTYGDLTQARSVTVSLSNKVVGIFGAGPGQDNNYLSVLDKKEFASGSNATVWGDLRKKASNVRGASDSHGGLQ